VFGFKMTIEFKIQKSPQVWISFENDVTTSPAISSVRSAFGDVFFSV
jgi:hypothetical protein